MTSQQREKSPRGLLPAIITLTCVLLFLRLTMGSNPSAPNLRWTEGEVFKMEGLRSMDGSPVSVEDWRGKVVVLNFWATWCPPCVRELPNLINLRDKTRDDNIRVYCVSDENVDKQSAFIDRQGHPRDLFLTSESATRSYVGSAIPVTLIIDGEGRVRSGHVGAAAWDADPVVQLLKDLAAGRTPGLPTEASSEGQ